MPRRIAYSKGQILGDHGLVYLEEASPQIAPDGRAVRQAWFQCSCGCNFSTAIKSVKCGLTTSCGCYRDGMKPPAYKDGRKSHMLYKTWYSMVGRCHNAKDSDYPNYGLRGIRVTDEWREDPFSFFRHVESEIGERPEGHTLDRIDNDGNYEPGNIRWANQSQQVRNRRPSRYWGYNE